MKAKLSECVVKAAEIGSRKCLLFDDDTPGFGLCVYTTGRKGFVLIYRIAGQQKRFTIWVWPTRWPSTKISALPASSAFACRPAPG